MPQQPAAPDTEAAATLAALREGLELANRKRANWFFIVATLSVVNSAVAVTGIKWSFPLGLGIAQVMDAVLAMPPREGHVPHPLFDLVFSVVVNFMAIGFYVTMGVLARYAFRWAYIVGLFAYVLDMFLTMAGPSLIGWMFHVFVIFALYEGLNACRRLVAIDMAQIAVPADSTRPRIIVPRLRGMGGSLLADTHSRIARRLVDLMRTSTASEHEIVEVDIRSFGHTSRTWYDRTQGVLETVGFRFVADIEDRTESLAARSVMYPSPERIMLSADGTTWAGIRRHSRRPFVALVMWLKGKGNTRSIEFVTEFADGTFVDTNNLKGLTSFVMPPQIRRQVFPQATPPASLHQSHMAAVADYQRDQSIGPLVFTSLPDIIASMKRCHLAQVQMRGRGSLMSLQEVERVTSGRKDRAACIYYSMLQLQGSRS